MHPLHMSVQHKHLSQANNPSMSLHLELKKVVHMKTFSLLSLLCTVQIVSYIMEESRSSDGHSYNRVKQCSICNYSCINEI